jgi:hypothetical protein
MHHIVTSGGLLERSDAMEWKNKIIYAVHFLDASAARHT